MFVQMLQETGVGGERPHTRRAGGEARRNQILDPEPQAPTQTLGASLFPKQVLCADHACSHCISCDNQRK